MMTRGEGCRHDRAGGHAAEGGRGQEHFSIDRLE
jgi:hypothetical protein